MLMVSQGIPMILSGDEMGNTQYGNNNAYCQDNEIGWLDWTNLQKNEDLYNYFRKIIRFRQAISGIAITVTWDIPIFHGMA